MKEIRILKPLYESNGYDFVNVRLSELHSKDDWVRIVTPKGEIECLVKDWIKTGKLVEQEFKIPGVPMKLVGNYVPHRKTKEELENAEIEKLKAIR